MRKDQERYIRDELRATLGAAMRSANAEVLPLKTSLERGYRWEPDEILVAMLAADELAEVSTPVANSLKTLLKRRDFTDSERERLLGAEKGVRRAAKYLRDIQGEEMIRLEKEWLTEGLPIAKGHEAYFLKRFGAAMRLLQLSWNKMFYATHKVRPRRMRLDERESAGFYNPMSDVGKHVRAEADEVAERGGVYVEVYDSDGDIAYVAQPPVEHMTTARPNPGRSERQDFELFEAIWDMRY